MGKWGSKAAKADTEVRKQTSGNKQIESRGQKVPDRLLQSRGEAITTRDDLREAAKVARQEGQD